MHIQAISNVLALFQLFRTRELLYLARLTPPIPLSIPRQVVTLPEIYVIQAIW